MCDPSGLLAASDEESHDYFLKSVVPEEERTTSETESKGINLRWWNTNWLVQKFT